MGYWDKVVKRWIVKIKADGKNRFMGGFSPKTDTPDEIQKALLAAIECMRKAEARHPIKSRRKTEARHPNMPVAEHQSGVKGVYWNSGSKDWIVKIRTNGEHRYMGCFHPKNNTPAEIQKA